MEKISFLFLLFLFLICLDIVCFIPITAFFDRWRMDEDLFGLNSDETARIFWQEKMRGLTSFRQKKWKWTSFLQNNTLPSGTRWIVLAGYLAEKGPPYCQRVNTPQNSTLCCIIAKSTQEGSLFHKLPWKITIKRMISKKHRILISWIEIEKRRKNRSI